MFVRKVVIENFKRFRGKRTFEFTNGLNILVGDNEIGKSTVLEAVHLALTGYYHGNRIERELSQYLFNKEATNEWLGKKNTPLPEIFIEVFLNDCKDAMYKGDFNSDKDGNAFGVRFSVVFNDEYKEEYEKIFEEKKISGLPIEYYKILWETFAREHITTRSVPIKSSLIDTSEYRYGNASDSYVSGIVKNYLEDEERSKLAQAYRELKEKFSENEFIENINKRLSNEIKSNAKASSPFDLFASPLTIGVDTGTANAWEKSLVVELGNIPLSYQGKGCQKMAKMELALSKKQSKNADIILLEEPENHLSFSKLNQLVAYIPDRCSEKQILVSTHSSFVANKLGLDELILVSENGCIRMKELSKGTRDFFKVLPGYDTLRLVLCEAAILVEGRSDELIVQRAYKDKYEKLPIEDGIDVISCEGLCFKRFLEIAEKLKLKDVHVVTDNDGDIEALEKKYENYLGKNEKENITICYDKNINKPSDTDPEKYNPNTLEPNLLKANSPKILNRIFISDSVYKDYKDEQALKTYMQENKTECALAIFRSSQKINYPEYIQNAVDFGEQKQ